MTEEEPGSVSPSEPSVIADVVQAHAQDRREDRAGIDTVGEDGRASSENDILLQMSLNEEGQVRIVPISHVPFAECSAWPLWSDVFDLAEPACFLLQPARNGLTDSAPQVPSSTTDSSLKPCTRTGG